MNLSFERKQGFDGDWSLDVVETWDDALRKFYYCQDDHVPTISLIEEDDEKNQTDMISNKALKTNLAPAKSKEYYKEKHLGDTTAIRNTGNEIIYLDQEQKTLNSYITEWKIKEAEYSNTITKMKNQLITQTQAFQDSLEKKEAEYEDTIAKMERKLEIQTLAFQDSLKTKEIVYEQTLSKLKHESEQDNKTIAHFQQKFNSQNEELKNVLQRSKILQNKNEKYADTMFDLLAEKEKNRRLQAELQSERQRRIHLENHLDHSSMVTPDKEQSSHSLR